MFEIEATGFDIVEIDRLLNFDDVASADALVRLPGADATAVSHPGDLWLIGQRSSP